MAALGEFTENFWSGWAKSDGFRQSFIWLPRGFPIFLAQGLQHEFHGKENELIADRAGSPRGSASRQLPVHAADGRAVFNATAPARREHFSAETPLANHH
jgi:hypothetical protein